MMQPLLQISANKNRAAHPSPVSCDAAFHPCAAAADLLDGEMVKAQVLNHLTHQKNA
jgi:hypothetical protein